MNALGFAAQSATAPLERFVFERRAPEPDEIAIDILYCGVCHTDLHLARNHGGYTTFPIVPGHEIVGRVREVGTDVSRFKSGDMVFMGVAAVNADYGFMDFEEDEARIRQALLRQSSRSVMLADHSKFGRVGNVITAPFKQIGTLVTDRRPPEDIVAAVRTEELEIVHG